MEREPAIEQPDSDPATLPEQDEAIDAWLAALPPCPGIPCTDEEVDAAIARARRQLDEGRGVPGEEVARWAAALGTADERPMPSEWLP